MLEALPEIQAPVAIFLSVLYCTYLDIADVEPVEHVPEALPGPVVHGEVEVAEVTLGLLLNVRAAPGLPVRRGGGAGDQGRGQGRHDEQGQRLHGGGGGGGGLLGSVVESRMRDGVWGSQGTIWRQRKASIFGS